MQTACFNRFSLDLPDECVADCAHQGPCDEDIEFWFLKLDTSAWPSADVIRCELHDYGAWSDNELMDVDANIRRLIWIAAGDIKEEMRQSAQHATDND